MSIEKDQFRTILTTRLLLECNGQLLFLEQTPLNGGGFTLPGGKIENEEFAKKALIREALEEIGIPLLKKDLQLVHVTHRKSEDTSEIILFFRCIEEIPIELTILETEKFQNAVWLPTDEIPDKLTNVLKKALESINKGKMFSQFPKIKKKEDPLAFYCTFN